MDSSVLWIPLYAPLKSESVQLPAGEKLVRISNRSKYIASAAICVAALQCSVSPVQGQIMLHPAQDPTRSNSEPWADSSRRQKPVSRERNATLPLGLNTPVLPHTNDRDLEFQQLQSEADALDRQLSFMRRIVKFASPSIVHIEATKRTDPGKGFASSRIEEAGAGVVINLNGSSYVLTNRHVIHPADINSIRVELNSGRQLIPSNVWTDPATDVAVIGLQEHDLVYARLGDSNLMEVGDFVLAVGSPFGLSHSVTYGILSAKGRRNLELGSKEIEIQDFFQTDAAINPGNSGGPLLNLRGEIVGINTAIASNSGGNEGIGFTIPINMALQVAEQLVSRGRLQRSYLGVKLENTFDAMTARRHGLSTAVGALVKSIIPNSPAQKAGIQEGDVILEFDSHKIQNDGHLVQTVGLTPVGQKVAIVILRQGRPARLETILEANPDF
ncbi:MAG: trypsin-like peptidase domain-containing protein [Planctomycetales bacterium]|nr:trypsin-like peptidase domain-containing protein [Planctomycetales bacterium]